MKCPTPNEDLTQSEEGHWAAGTGRGWIMELHFHLDMWAGRLAQVNEQRQLPQRVRAD